MEVDKILALARELIKAKMEIKNSEYVGLLKREGIDKKELGALTAGYKKALDDLDKVLIGINEK